MYLVFSFFTLHLHVFTQELSESPPVLSSLSLPRPTTRHRRPPLGVPSRCSFRMLEEGACFPLRLVRRAQLQREEVPRQPMP